MTENVLHILGTARPEGASIARIVAALAKRLDGQRYMIHAWFLAGNGPLVAELQAAGAEARSIDWCGGARDPAGAWRFWHSLKGENSRSSTSIGEAGPRAGWLARQPEERSSPISMGTSWNLKALSLFRSELKAQIWSSLFRRRWRSGWMEHTPEWCTLA